MATNNSISTFSSILKNLKSFGVNTPITIYLNNHDEISNISLETSYSLSVSTNCNADCTISSTDIFPDLSFNLNHPVTLDIEETISIPPLPIDIETNPQSIPITTKGISNVSLNINGVAKGILPHLEVNSIIPENSISLPISATTSGNVNLISIGELNIPATSVIGKTLPSEIDIDIKGSSTTDVSVQGQATGIIPPLKVIGVTDENNLSLDIETTADYTIASEKLIDTFQSGNDSITFELSGTATGKINPINVNGVTDRSEINLPVMAEGQNSVDIDICGSLPIQELDVKLDIPSHSLPLSTTCHENISLETTGVAKGIIPKTTITGHSKDIPISIPIEGKSQGDVSLTSNGLLNLPSQNMNFTIPEQKIPLNFKYNTYLESKIDYIPSPSNISFSTTIPTKDLPIAGEINVEGKLISTSPKITGYIDSILSDFITIRDILTDELTYLKLQNILRVEFVSPNSIIETNKGIISKKYSSIETSLHEIWSNSFSLSLMGSNTTNPIKPSFNTDDIKYINKGILWLENKHKTTYHNTLYLLSNIIGFKLKTKF